MSGKKYQVLRLVVLYDPKKEQFHNELQGNPDLSCKDFINIMVLLADQVDKSDAKTMGEFFKSWQK